MEWIDFSVFSSASGQLDSIGRLFALLTIGLQLTGIKVSFKSRDTLTSIYTKGLEPSFSQGYRDRPISRGS